MNLRNINFLLLFLILSYLIYSLFSYDKSVVSASLDIRPIIEGKVKEISSNKEDQHYKVSIIFTSLGIKKELLDEIKNLPKEVAIGISPYADPEDIKYLRRDIFIELPFEPLAYPLENPGLYGILTYKGKDNNLKLVEEIYTKFSKIHLKGFYSKKDEKFSSLCEMFEPILEYSENKNLLFLYPRHNKQCNITDNTITNIITIEGSISEEEILHKINEVNENLKSQKYLLIYVMPGVKSFQYMKQWIASLRKNIQLVPVKLMQNPLIKE